MKNNTIKTLQLYLLYCTVHSEFLRAHKQGVYSYWKSPAILLMLLGKVYI